MEARRSHCKSEGDKRPIAKEQEQRQCESPKRDEGTGDSTKIRGLKKCSVECILTCEKNRSATFSFALGSFTHFLSGNVLHVYFYLKQEKFPSRMDLHFLKL